MAILTVNSLSITPALSWPVDATAGIIASTTKAGEKCLRFVADGESLPSSSVAGTWSGTPTVQTDFSP